MRILATSTCIFTRRLALTQTRRFSNQPNYQELAQKVKAMETRISALEQKANISNRHWLHSWSPIEIGFAVLFTAYGYKVFIKE